MLAYFKKNNLVSYPKEQPKHWQDAIRLSCQNLLEEELITEDYVQAIIDSVLCHGPYIVIVPGVAMPHATSDHPGVVGTAISFTKFQEDVVFWDDSVQEEKRAQLFFTLAAQDANQHLENIQHLMDLLEEDGLIERLLATECMEDFDELIHIH